MSIDVALQRLPGFQLTVVANVPNATVTVNNMVRGGTPYMDILPPGPYNLRVSAPGYTDFITTINLTRAMTMNVQLHRQLLPPTFSIVIPPEYQNPDVRQGDPRSQVRIYVDNQQVNSRNERNEMERFQVAPGRHSIRVASGALSIQVGDIDMQPGTSYTFELSMDLKVRVMQAAQ
jgi:hypothetical protein